MFLRIKNVLRASHGLFLIGGSGALEKIIHLGTFFGLTLLLEPEDYGLFALAWIVIAVADSFFDFGSSLGYMSSAKSGDKNQYKKILNGAAVIFSLFWFSVCAIVGCVLLLSGNEKVGELIIPTAFIFLLKGYIYPCTTTLSLNKEYKSLSILQITPAILGGVAGFWFAKEGAGVWALVLRYLVAGASSCLILTVISPYTKKIVFNLTQIRTWLRHGWMLSVSNNVGWLVVYQVEQAVIGSTMGPAVLGLYNFARKPADIASQVLSQIGSRFYLPSYITDQIGIIRVYKDATFVACLCGFFSVLGYFVAKLAILNFWSEDWHPVINILPLAFVIIPLISIETVFKYFLAARGSSRIILIVNLSAAAVSIPLFLLAATMGLHVQYFLWVAIVILTLKIGAFFIVTNFYMAERDGQVVVNL